MPYLKKQTKLGKKERVVSSSPYSKAPRASMDIGSVQQRTQQRIDLAAHAKDFVNKAYFTRSTGSRELLSAGILNP